MDEEERTEVGEGQSELLETLSTIRFFTDLNFLFRVPDVAFKVINGGLQALISRNYESYLTIDRVALYFEVSERTIYRWKKRGFPSGRKTGSQITWTIAEIRQWAKVRNKNKSIDR